MSRPSFDPSSESLAYHAARILLLIRRCGSPQQSTQKMPGVKGRTLLAKLDFFLRYPTYLLRAARIAEVEETSTQRVLAQAALMPEPAQTVEAPMVRYKYGPWDHTYYLVLAYLIGKGLIQVDIEGRTEVFRVTDRGREVADALGETPAYAELVGRASLVHGLFGSFSGNRLKTYIYDRFPEVVARKHDELI